MRWRAILAMSLAVAACGGASDVADTDCADPERAADQVRVASIVLLGTVTAWDGTTARFEIGEIWRGPDLANEVDITPEDGRAFTTGVEYLVFPSYSASPLVDRPCSATTRWVAELEELRPATARVPGASPADDADLPWEWAIAGGVLAAVLLAGRRILEKRRHPEPAWDPDYNLDEAP